MDRKYLLGLYEKAMPSRLTWAEKLQAAKDAGFDYVEMSVDETDGKLARLDMTDGEVDAIRAAMRATGLGSRMRHCSIMETRLKILRRGAAMSLLFI